jgi:hypothetical protein
MAIRDAGRQRSAIPGGAKLSAGIVHYQKSRVTHIPSGQTS